MRVLKLLTQLSAFRVGIVQIFPLTFNSSYMHTRDKQLKLHKLREGRRRYIMKIDKVHRVWHIYLFLTKLSGKYFVETNCSYVREHDSVRSLSETAISRHTIRVKLNRRFIAVNVGAYNFRFWISSKPAYVIIRLVLIISLCD